MISWKYTYKWHEIWINLIKSNDFINNHDYLHFRFHYIKHIQIERFEIFSWPIDFKIFKD